MRIRKHALKTHIHTHARFRRSGGCEMREAEKRDTRVVVVALGVCEVTRIRACTAAERKAVHAHTETHTHTRTLEGEVQRAKQYSS